MGSARAIDTGMEGFRLWPGALCATAQSGLLAGVLAAVEQSAFFRPVTPGGRPFSVEMTNLGPLGWVSDRAGYRYQPTHPETGAPWPSMPETLLTLWSDLTGWPDPPDACLVNLYRGGARMGLRGALRSAETTGVADDFPGFTDTLRLFLGHFHHCRRKSARG